MNLTFTNPSIKLLLKRSIRIALMLLFVLGAGLFAVNAQTITVTTNLDENDGDVTSLTTLMLSPGGTGISLREAIIATNNEPGTATVTINVPANTYTLTIAGAGENLAATGDLDINAGGLGENKTVNIIGAGAVFSHMIGVAGDRIFEFHALNTAGSITVNMVGMYLTAGNLASGSGGAILAGRPGDITILDGCVFSNNSAPNNGGVISQSSGAAMHNLIVTNCSFAGNNAAAGAGGAINYSGLGTVTITNTRFAQNVSGTQGGAINISGTGTGPSLCTLTENTFVQNTANGATYGGAAIALVNVVSINANYNRIVLNNGTAVATGKLISTGGGTVGAMNFDNNWWGTNAGPAGATDVLGTLPTRWLQLKNTASPNPICNGTNSTITASFLSNNLNEAIAVSDLNPLIGGPVNFQNEVNGTLTSAQTTIQANGTTTVTFTATTVGNGTVNARFFAAEENFSSITNPVLVISGNPAIGGGGQPANAAVCPNGNTSFTVSATGGGLMYQWRRGVTNLTNGLQGSGSTVTGTTTSMLNITNAQPGDVAADYNVVVTNVCNTTTSTNASLTLNAAPLVTTNPMNTSVGNGGSTSFTAAFSGTPTPGLQWQVSTTGIGGVYSALVNGAPYSGVTTGTLTINPAAFAMNGYAYRCVATNSCSPSATSNEALLTVTLGPTSSVLSVNGPSTICNGGTANLIVTITGGTSPYTVVYSNGTSNFTVNNYVSGTNIPVSPTVTTTYSLVSVTDANLNPGTGNSGMPTVTVNPTPVGSATAQTICSGGTTSVMLNSSVGGTTYTYTAAIFTTPAGGTITGHAGGSANPIAQILMNTGTTAGVIRYTVTPTANSCPGANFTVDVTVNPTPIGSATAQTICSGGTTSVMLNSSVGGTTYTYAAAIFTTPTGGTITGHASGSANPIAQTLTNTGTSPGVIRYTVTPTANSCPGANFTVDVTVNPTPIGSATAQTICSGGTTGVTLNSTVAGTTYSYTAAIQTTPTGGSITGHASGSANPIAQTLTNTGTSPGVIRYTVTPTANSCPGANFTVDVTVNPTPIGSATAQTICSGGTTGVTLNSTVAGTTYSYTAAIQTTPTGGTITGHASGSANPIAQTLVNTGTTAGVIRYTVTPTANSCPGANFTVDVTVNPIPVGGTNLSVTIPYTGAPVAIPDNTPAGVNIPLTVGGVGTIADIDFNLVPGVGTCDATIGNVNASIDHTWNGDLTIRLISPAATTLTVINRRGGSGNNFCAVTLDDDGAFPATSTMTTAGAIAGTYLPESPLSVFDGQNADGVWTLNVSDNAGLDFGNVRGFSLRFSGVRVTTICSGSTTNIPLTASTPAGGTTYSYTAAILTPPTGGTITGHGSGTANPIAQTLTNTGTTAGVVRYTIIPMYTNAGATCNGAPYTVDVIVNPRPVGSATPPSQAICSGSTTSITLNATTAVAGTTYSYTAAIQTAPAGGTITGFSGGTANPIAQTLTNTGTNSGVVRYTVTPSYTNAGVTCTGTPFTVDVTVNKLPTITCPANITIASPVGSCALPVTYTTTVTGGPAPTLTYALSGATTGSGNGNGSGSTFNVGVTTVMVTATNLCGSASCTFTVTVTDSQLPVINTQPVNRTLCAGGTTTFSVAAVTAPSAGGPLSYQWQIWNGTAWVAVTGATGATTNTLTLSNVTHSMNTNSYRVQLIGLCTTVNSNFATLFVNPLPTITLTTSIPPALIPTQVLTITATPSSAGGSYVWSKNGVVIGGATSSILNNLTVNDLGTYRVVYTDANGCVVTSSNIVITALQSQNLYVYPVPNRGVFNVRFYNQTNEEVTIRVFDMKGSEVYQRKMSTTQPYTTMIVDLTTGRILTSGTYIVEVRGAGGRLVGTRKIIVQN